MVEQKGVPIARATHVQRDQKQKITMVGFQTTPEIAVALRDAEVTALISGLLQAVVTAGASDAGQEPKTVTAMPIDVTSLGVSPGRSETEALLAIRTGPTVLTFAVDLSILDELCRDLLPNLRKIEPGKSHSPPLPAGNRA